MRDTYNKIDEIAQSVYSVFASSGGGIYGSVSCFMDVFTLKWTLEFTEFYPPFIF